VGQQRSTSCQRGRVAAAVKWEQQQQQSDGISSNRYQKKTVNSRETKKDGK
jgi:hypothetical protein